MSSHSSAKFPAANDKKNFIILVSVIIIGSIALLGIIFLRQRQTLITPAQTIIPEDTCQSKGGVVFQGTSCPNGEEIIGKIDIDRICCRAPETESSKEEEVSENKDISPTTSEQPSPTSSSALPTSQQPTSAPSPTLQALTTPQISLSPSPTDIVVVVSTNTPTPKSGIGGASGGSSTTLAPTSKPANTSSPSKTPTQVSYSSPSKINQSSPTTKPTLPKSGVPQASFLILGLGILVIALGLAL